MTKKVKHRKLKLFKQWLSAKRKVTKRKIIYINYNILYKLNFIKRFSYRTNEEEVFGVQLRKKEVVTKYFRGTVKMNLVCSKDIELDYFYRELKDGSKKILYTVKDFTETALYAVSHLEDIYFRIGDVWYNVNSLPTFKVNVDTRLKPSSEESVLERPNYRTVTYDVNRLKRMEYRQYLGHDLDPNEVSSSRMTKQYYYNKAYDMFAEKLESIKLSDLMI